MDFSLSAEQRLFVDQVRRFASAHLRDKAAVP